MDKERLLEHRKKAKKVKPTFVVRESKFSSGVKKRWRYPRGMHSAVRQQHKGRPALPSTGYGSPRVVRGLDKSGLLPVRVHTENELLALDSKIQGAVISGKLGMKNKLSLLKIAQKKNIILLNVKDSTVLIEDLQKSFEERKKRRDDRLKSKDKKEESKRKKAEEKKEKKEKADKESQENNKEKKEGSVEDKLKDEKTEEKKIAEKVITKRQ
jgi:large subunit ribosomal protein L32e